MEQRRMFYEKPSFILVKVVSEQGFAATTGPTGETFINEEDLY